MKRLSAFLTITAVALLGVAGATAVERGHRPSAAGPDLVLSGGASSQDELISLWLAALAANDEQALHRLRVTRDEYMAIMVPWTVKPGEPPRTVSEQPREFFWQLLDTRSRDLGYAMLQNYGGRHFTPRKLEFSEAPREYAAYTAYGLVRLEAAGEDGKPVMVEGPWIAEVGGKFKFIGLDWTD